MSSTGTQHFSKRAAGIPCVGPLVEKRGECFSSGVAGAIFFIDIDFGTNSSATHASESVVAAGGYKLLMPTIQREHAR